MTTAPNRETSPQRQAIPLGGAILAGIFWLLPMILLVPAALILLYGTVWFWVWLVFSALSAAMGVVVWRRWRRRPLNLNQVLPDRRSRDAKEAEAWTAIDQITKDTDPTVLADRAKALGLILDIVEAVAKVYHPDDRRPLLGTTVPEVLLLTEQVSARVRRLVLTSVPFGDQVKIGQLARATDLAPYWQSVRHAYDIWRIVRTPLNPVAALVGEARDWATRALGDAAMDEAGRRVMAILVAEIGQSAIDLYSGRLRLSAAELTAAADQELAEAATETLPPRVLLIGPSGAGKSTLVNGLGKAVLAAVDSLPSTRDMTPYALSLDGQPALILIDSPGLDGTEGTRRALLKAARDADLILWVTAANRPDRAEMAQMANSLRSLAGTGGVSPPMIAAVTHIDRLPPHGEWAPPYALSQALTDRPSPDAGPRIRKTYAIAGACAQTAEDLGLSTDKVVPLVPDETVGATNLDLLWAALTIELPNAQARTLARHLKESVRFDMERLSTQVTRAFSALATLTKGG